MNTTNSLKHESALRSFKSIMDSKYNISPIAEKASRNLEAKYNNKVNRNERLHYFSLGHRFKALDFEALFEPKLDPLTKAKKASRFTSLLHFTNDHVETFKGLVDVFRHINSHYVHSYDKIRLDTINASVLQLITEAFEFAVLVTYCKENAITTIPDHTYYPTIHKDIVGYLFNRFYPQAMEKGNEQEKKDRNNALKREFTKLSLTQAIEQLLFVELDADMDWKLQHFDGDTEAQKQTAHTAFSIKAGRYLSFNACLFIASMFLYRSEAKMLISKIAGYKLNKLAKHQSKRDIVTFFAKKFGSRDASNEEMHLVKFHDMIGYLSRYPVAWNADLELKSSHEQMTNRLKAQIADRELRRIFGYQLSEDSFSYIKPEQHERFLVFAKRQLFLNVIDNKSIEREYAQKQISKQDKLDFQKEFNASKELRDAERKLQDIKDSKPNRRREDNILKQEQLLESLRLKNEPNTDVAKLKNRITQNTFFTSYGRNQDKFIEFAARYLAETNYFGAAACFKLYRYYDMTTQERVQERIRDYIKVSANADLAKKKYDNLPFHQGKITYFNTFSKHLRRYDNWDMPFVVSNNAIQVQLRSGRFGTHTITLQRAALVYLLEHALYGCQQAPEGEGLKLLTKYFTTQQADQLSFKQQIESNSITNECEPSVKRKLKQLLPKRLVHHYCAPEANDPHAQSALKNILDQAIRAEKRYQDLHLQAQEAGCLDDFLKRNKGKQFKLQFVRKAWNILWFKDSYKQQKQHADDHHKDYHITRDEFNNFCRYMFAFDSEPAYKEYLYQLLDAHTFFNNAAFKQLFETSNSLQELYDRTKTLYEQWLSSNAATRSRTDHHQLAAYDTMFAGTQLYINLQHFTTYLKAEQKVEQLLFQALENRDYLIADYYYAAKLEKHEYKSCRKLYNDLHTARLEDALLYEVALRYLQFVAQTTKKKGEVIEPTQHDLSMKMRTASKKHLDRLLTDDVAISILDENELPLYTLSVPFKQLDRYVEQFSIHYTKLNFKNSLHAQLPSYLDVLLRENARLAKQNNELKVIGNAFKKDKALTLDQFNKIENLHITSSLQFTRIALALEEYFIVKDVLQKGTKNRIDFKQITSLHSYFDKETRDGSFHFGVPLDANEQVRSYHSILQSVEASFIANELRPAKPTSYLSLSREQKAVCDRLLTSLHNDLIERKGKDVDWDAVNETYFNNCIKQG